MVQITGIIVRQEFIKAIWNLDGQSLRFELYNIDLNFKIKNCKIN